MSLRRSSHAAAQWCASSGCKSPRRSNCGGSRSDIYLAGQDLLARRGLNAKRTVTLSGLTIPLAPPEYVILHKLRFRQQGGSERHLRDVRAMLRVLGDSVDVANLRVDAESMGLDTQWDAMERLTE